MRFVRIAAIAGALTAVTLVVVDALAARNSTGTMSLYSPGNPVTSGTPVSSSWANNTLNDIATEISDSLSRSGKGPMLATLSLYSGTVGTPGLNFSSDTGSGLYRIGSNNIGLSINGTKRQEWTTTGTAVTGTWSASSTASLANGTVGTPAINFTNDTGSGLYRIGSNDIGFAINGVKVSEHYANGIMMPTTIPLNLHSKGSVPALGFNLAYDGSNTYYLTTNPGAVLDMDASGNVLFLTTPSGTASTAATMTERLRVNPSGVTIGSGGTAIALSGRGTGTFTPGSIASGGCVSASITISGATIGTECAFGTPNLSANALVYSCAITGNTVCTISACNPTAGNLTGNTGTYTCRFFN